MTVFITGGLGFIGSHITREFLESGARVVVNRFGSEPVAPFLQPHLGKGLSVEPLDIVSPHGVIDLCRRHAVESVVHFAGPRIGEIPAIEEYRINTAGLLNVLEAARIVGAKRVSLASSIIIYFGIDGPLREDMPVRLKPTHAIEAFKKAEELLGSYLAGEGGFEFLCLRMANIYGPLYLTRRHLPSQIVHAGVRGGKAPLGLPGLPPFYNDDDAPDYCYVEDAARGVRLVHQSNALRHQVYNIGGGQAVTNARFAEAGRTVFPQLEITLQPGTGPNNWRGATLDITRAQEDAGYAPRHSIEQAMERYAAWLREGHAF